MQLINKNLLLFLNNNLNPDYIFTNSCQNFDNVFSFFREYNSILDYDYYLNKFPIYRITNFRPLTSLKLQNGSFSSLKIKTVVSDSLDGIKNNLSPDVLVTKQETDQYYNDPTLIKFTTSLQKTVIDDEHLNTNTMELNTARLDTDYDYFFYILNRTNIPNYHNSYEDVNPIEVFTLYYMILNLFINNTNFYRKMTQLLYNEDITHDLLKNNFEEFFLNNSEYNQETESFASILTNFIHRKVFNVFDPSEHYIDLATENIEKNFIPNIVECFKQYIGKEEITKKIIVRHIRRIQNIFGYLIFKEALNENVFDFFNENYNRTTELDFQLSYDYVNKLIEQKMSVNNLKKYMMPVYLNKNEPLKFLNVISRFVQLYCDEYLNNYITYVNNPPSRTRTENNINHVLTNLSHENLHEYLNNFDYQKILDDNDLGWLMSFMFTNDIIKEFCHSSSFTDCIIHSLNNTKDYLYKHKWIRQDFNWYRNIDLIRHFILSYLLKHMCVEENGDKYNYIFKDLENIFDSYLNDTISQNDFFESTPETFRTYLDNMRGVDFLKHNIYQGNSNILDATVKKQIYFQIMSYYMQ